jgi:hypothetical protein
MGDSGPRGASRGLRRSLVAMNWAMQQRGARPAACARKGRAGQDGQRWGGWGGSLARAKGTWKTSEGKGGEGVGYRKDCEGRRGQELGQRGAGTERGDNFRQGKTGKLWLRLHSINPPRGMQHLQA